MSPSPKGSSSKPAKSPASKGEKPKKRSKVTFSNYPAAVKYLSERMDIERAHPGRVDPAVFKLDRMRAILGALDNPHDSLKCVHIGGTNGKGSTVAMTTACLRAAGYTVGAYTSPHVVDLRERIQINDHPIAHAHFVEVMGRVATAAASISPRLGEPTFFEIITACGFEHFAEQAVDIAVIEVGLGGKLDSTNVITPEVAAVTSISLDHTQILGATTPMIAEQKAGIFKADRPALTVPQEPAVVEKMRAVAAANGTSLEVLGIDVEFSCRFEANPQLGPHTRVGLSTDKFVFEHVPVPLPGEHQASNCGLTLAILDKLARRGFELTERKILTGLESVSVPCRMELAWRQPRVLLDGAHNPAAMSALIKAIGAHLQYDSMVMIFGCAADKDVDEMLRRVGLGADKVVFTRTANSPRAANPHTLHRRFNELCGKMSQVAEDLEEALKIAGRAAGRDDLIVVTGSFYLAGEAKKLLAARQHKADTAAVAAAAAAGDHAHA